MKKAVVFLVLMSFANWGHGQISAKLMRYVDVSDSHITFVYGGDIWIVDVEGGTALPVTNSPGEESYPRFSPDGQYIGYTASYNGNLDVYTVPIQGGVPHRVTYQSHPDRMLDWHPDGERILFASRRHMGQRGSRQFYLVGKAGGLPEKLPIPYGELASYSADGQHLAYITKITENYPFKRYRGGLASDILLYDAQQGRVEQVTNNHANDGQPSFGGNGKVYFLSDMGEEIRLNIYSYDPSSKETKRLTEFKDFDISFMKAGNTNLVFEAGGTLYLMDLASESYQQVEVNIVSDLSAEMSRAEDVSGNIAGMTASPEGKRIVFEARGELFNVPVKEGYTVNLTKSSGAFDRSPAWSPDGKHLAFWSDRSGENEIYLQDPEGKSEARQLTKRNGGYGYTLWWSPDSKSISYIDEKNDIYIIDAKTGEERKIDNSPWNLGHPSRSGFEPSWSTDSRWLAYGIGQENGNGAIIIYDTKENSRHQVTSGFYSDFEPVWSKDNHYLFFLTNRNFRPHYSDMNDGTWVYPNATQVAALSLTKEAPHLLGAKNDSYQAKEEEKEEEDKGEETDESEGKKKDGKLKDGDKSDEAGEKEEEKKDEKSVKIDFEDIESRVTILPPSAGNMGDIETFEGKLVYLRFSNTGSSRRSSSLVMYDLKEREEKTVISNLQGHALTADGKAILVRSGGKFGIIKPAPEQKIKDAIPTDGLVMNLVPREEWRQIFHDTWRRHRDFFYDPNMHGLDWNALREQYGALIEDARTRWDVSFIQSNLAAELSAGHTYTFGGDNERAKPVGTGYLGIDWEIADGSYRIKRIVRPAAWDTGVRSPFDVSGIKVKQGDIIHSVNGVDLATDRDPYAAFEGLDGEVVSLMVSTPGDEAEPRQVIIETLTQGEEARLRYLEWIENNRKMVDELSDGKLGYVYMSNTAGQGQLELVSMYYGQLHKDGFIIDERFNGGGQLADRFLELLQRPIVYNLHWRHGKDHTWPTAANNGPMGMLINGWAGSGGDGLPWAFQELEAGPIVGERTLGILVGPATGHRLIDGGGITVPGARLYDNDGHWFWEGEGVAPDIEVWDDPNLLMQGRDPQIERVVQEVMKAMESAPPKMTPAPAREDRTAAGLNKE